MEQFEWKDTFGKTPQSFHKRVQNTLDGLPEKKEPHIMMKSKFTIKKAVVLSLAAALAIGTTVFAAGKISTITSSSSKSTEFHALPTAAEVKEKCGFDAKYVSAFSNGYTFDSGNVIDTSAYDDDKNKVAATKELDLSYKNQDATVSLSVSGSILDDMSTEKSAPVHYNQVNIYYQNQDYKFEPADYKMTAQDKADEASGKYEFSYGSQKEEIENFQSITWAEDGKEYNLQAQNSTLTQQELTTMAQEVIDSSQQ